MIAVDTNVLVHAHRADSALHERAREAVRALAEGQAPWAIPWPCAHEFLAIVTHPRIFDPPTPVPLAIAQLRAWLGSSAVQTLAELPDHLDLLAQELESSRVAGARVHDARIAALCIAQGVTELWTADRDFLASLGSGRKTRWSEDALARAPSLKQRRKFRPRYSPTPRSRRKVGPERSMSGPSMSRGGLIDGFPVAAELLHPAGARPELERPHVGVA